ncbi:MAG: hypothetical protein KGD63_08175 [Candidatus Lokiarchaeota archaeon]|nr:hypothetical protein [Candidatus Lokiarchaeota archaeon]
MDNNLEGLDNLVIIDSNFILLPIQFHIDYIEEIIYKIEGKTEFIIFKQILDELDAKENRFKSKKSSIFQTQYNTGLKYLNLKKKNLNIFMENQIKVHSETTDDFLIRKAIEIKEKSAQIRIYLATNDSELRKKAKNSGIYTIFLRQKKFISIEGPNIC